MPHPHGFGTAIFHALAQNPTESPVTAPMEDAVDSERQAVFECCKRRGFASSRTSRLTYHLLLIPYCATALALLGIALFEFILRRLTRDTTYSSFKELACIRLKLRLMSRLQCITGYHTNSAGASLISWRIFLEFLLPSRRIQSSERHKNYERKGKEITAQIDAELESCHELIKILRNRRCHHVQSMLERNDATPEQLRHYLDSIVCASQTKHHLESLDKEKNEIIYIANTQALLDASGYRGLTDWSQRALESHKDLIEALYQVSFVGAGLTYSTVFSASRGNIGLMCYAFALFNCGFIVPLVALALLKWASNCPRRTLFATPQVWSFLLNFAIYISVGAVVSAICLLNVTIIFLHFQEGDDGAPQDSQPQFNVPPAPAGGLALICAVVAIFATLFALMLYYTANGWGSFATAIVGRRCDNQPSRHLDDYILC